MESTEQFRGRSYHGGSKCLGRDLGKRWDLINKSKCVRPECGLLENRNWISFTLGHLASGSLVCTGHSVNICQTEAKDTCPDLSLQSILVCAGAPGRCEWQLRPLAVNPRLSREQMTSWLLQSTPLRCPPVYFFLYILLFCPQRQKSHRTIILVSRIGLVGSTEKRKIEKTVCSWPLM